jgi:hypothetical protein
VAVGTLELVGEGVGPEGLESVGEEEEEDDDDGHVGVLQHLQDEGGVLLVHR